jgi:hypothetical protein
MGTSLHFSILTISFSRYNITSKYNMRVFAISTVVGLSVLAQALEITKDARCGSAGKGTTCLTSQWGDCCSDYGYW